MKSRVSFLIRGRFRLCQSDFFDGLIHSNNLIGCGRPQEPLLLFVFVDTMLLSVGVRFLFLMVSLSFLGLTGGFVIAYSLDNVVKPHKLFCIIFLMSLMICNQLLVALLRGFVSAS